MTYVRWEEGELRRKTEIGWEDIGRGGGRTCYELDLGRQLSRQHMPASVFSVGGLEGVKPVLETVALSIDPKLHATWR